MQDGSYPPELWHVPDATIGTFRPKQSDYCVVIPVLNEGERLKRVLTKMQAHLQSVDIIVADKGSTDGSTEPTYLESVGVRSVITLTGEGALSAQLRAAYSHALKEGYRGIVTIDGNDKDDVGALPQFISKLKDGYDFVQASRFLPGGKGVHTPWVRYIAIRLIHAPVISFLSKFRYTDTTQGYRGYSSTLLSDKRLAIFRDCFSRYELLAYLSVKAPQLGFRVLEVPVTRTYPANVKTPTKISSLSAHWDLIQILIDLAYKKYDPK